MDAAAILAVVDAGITVYERAMQVLDEARKAGIISVEEQAERMAKVDDLKKRLGL